MQKVMRKDGYPERWAWFGRRAGATWNATSTGSLSVRFERQDWIVTIRKCMRSGTWNAFGEPNDDGLEAFLLSVLLSHGKIPGLTAL
jgi:hypothetical protein